MHTNQLDFLHVEEGKDWFLWKDCFLSQPITILLLFVPNWDINAK